MAPPKPNSAAAKLLADRILARRRLLHFTKLTHPRYSAGWVHDDICRRLERFSREVAEGKSPRLMLLMPPRHGKALQSDQVLPTPSGMRTHGSLKVGDFVYHPSGKAVRVLAVSPDVQVDVEVEFFDGTTVVCHENHEWTVYDRARGEWRTVETKYLESQKLVSGPKQRARFQIPLYNALEGAPQTLPLDPYFLGAWLGDGSSSEPVICGAEADLAHVVSLIPYPRGFRSVHKDTRVVYQGFVGGVRTALRTHNLLNNKHIPEVYFLASVEQRRRLLADLGEVAVASRLDLLDLVNRACIPGQVLLDRDGPELGPMAGSQLHRGCHRLVRTVRAVIGDQYLLEHLRPPLWGKESSLRRPAAWLPRGSAGTRSER